MFEHKKRQIELLVEDKEDLCEQLKVNINEDPDFGNDEVESGIIITKQKILVIKVK